VKNGVPFDIAFGTGIELDAIERSAIAIIISEFEGGKFNWNNLSWEKQD
jgi:hypothetical protein